MFRMLLAAVAGFFLFAGTAHSQPCGSSGYMTLANGTSADATQVMGNFTYVINCFQDGTKAISPGAINVGSITTNGLNNVTFNGSTQFGFAFMNSDQSGVGQLTQRFMRRNSGGTYLDVGSITTTGSGTAYNTSSDRRLKQGFSDLSDVGGIIDAVSPRRWTWKVNGNPGIGFVAQELAVFVPEAVVIGDNDPNLEPNQPGFTVWARDDSKLVPYLWAEVKALRARVAAMEQKMSKD